MATPKASREEVRLSILSALASVQRDLIESGMTRAEALTAVLEGMDGVLSEVRK